VGECALIKFDPRSNRQLSISKNPLTIFLEIIGNLNSK